MAEKGIRHRPRAKKCAQPISPEARKLIRSALRRCKGSQRGAARLLGLGNNLQLMRMLRGEMRETPAMRAAVIRAKARADRAFRFLRPAPAPVDLDAVRRLVAELRRQLDVLAYFVKE